LVGSANSLQELDRAGGTGDGAGVAGLAVLVEEIGKGAAADVASLVRQDLEDAASPEDAADLVVIRVKVDPLDRMAVRVTAADDREVLITIAARDTLLVILVEAVAESDQARFESGEIGSQGAAQDPAKERIVMVRIAATAEPPSIEGFPCSDTIHCGLHCL
jgi:hypothetical protein